MVGRARWDEHSARLLRLAAALRAGERLLDGCWLQLWLRLLRLRLWLHLLQERDARMAQVQVRM